MRPARRVIPAKAGTRRPETHRPRTRPGLRPAGAEHDLAADGVSGTGDLPGAAARGEPGCGDDLKWTRRPRLPCMCR